MSFYFSDTAVLLFDFWSVHTPTGAVLAMGWEGGEEVGFSPALPFADPSLCLLPKPISSGSWPRGAAGCPSPSLMGFPISFHRWFQYHVGQTLFHVVQVVLGYMVMLAVMSYNAWIFLGAIVGSTLGYFVGYPLLGRG
uniref:Copper transport protein n=1 Tax=Bubo bubo TaxID=30461 RepID=A0A8C0I913_BUBBB